LNLISNESIEMNENKYVFITDLINKYNNPIVANPISISTSTSTIIRKDNIRNRFNSIICGDADNEDTKDAGTLFKEAYDLRKKHRASHNNSDMNDIELKEFKINQNSNDLL
jgi:hypothetical protein